MLITGCMSLFWFVKSFFPCVAMLHRPLICYDTCGFKIVANRFEFAFC